MTVPNEEHAPSVRLTFSNGAEIECYPAITRRGRTIGLRAYPHLQETQGLWLKFENDCTPYFWNRGVEFPVDIAFISSLDMKIHSIIKMEANSTRIIMSPKPAMYAVEVRAGVFDEIGVEIGTSMSQIERI